MRKVLAFVGLLCLAAASIAQSSPFTITWSTYKSGQFSNVNSFKTFTMRNQSDFAQYWAESTGNPAGTAPRDIDWLKNEVLAIHLGKRSGDGYSVYVSNIDMVTGANYNVQVVEQVPGKQARAGDRSSSPFTIILLPRRYATYNVAITKQTADSDGSGGGWGHHGGGGNDGHGGHGGGGHDNDRDDSVYDAKNVGGRVGFREIESGYTLSGPTAMTMDVLRSDREWDRFWRVASYRGQIYRNGSSRSGSINWRRNQVLVLQSTSAVDLVVTDVRKSRDGFSIFVTKTIPSVSNYYYPANFPYVVIELPGQTGKMDITVSIESGG